MTQCLLATLISNVGTFCYCVIFHRCRCSSTADTCKSMVANINTTEGKAHPITYHEGIVGE